MRLRARTLCGLFAAMVRATSMAASNGVAVTWVAKPYSRACVPENSRPVKYSSRSRSGRTSPRMSWVPPMSGTSPQRTSITASLASGAT